VEVRYRHVVRSTDGFSMRPGFESFARVHAGQALADDATGPVKCPESGRILLPLYQGVGDDGFFLSRDVRPFWLRLSAWLRQLRADRLLAWLPGIRRHAELPDTLVADPGVARWLVLEIFHLFGFRKLRSEPGKLVFSRRRPDHLAVDSVASAVGLEH
jgi:succinylglutamate desuccinylase